MYIEQGLALGNKFELVVGLSSFSMPTEDNNRDDDERICIIGSGNWGSAIARIVGDNAAKYSEFATTVEMYTYEEDVRASLSILFC